MARLSKVDAAKAAGGVKADIVRLPEVWPPQRWRMASLTPQSCSGLDSLYTLDTRLDVHHLTLLDSL